jgi:hypothetical protein
MRKLVAWVGLVCIGIGVAAVRPSYGMDFGDPGSPAEPVIEAEAAEPGLAADTIELARRVSTGERHNLKVNADYRIWREGAESLAELRFRFGAGMALEIETVDPEGNAQGRMTLHSLAMKTAGPLGAGLDYDSTDPFVPATLENLILGSLVGLNYQFRLDPSGRLSEVKGLDDALRKAEGLLPGNALKRSLLNQVKDRLDYEKLMGVAGDPHLYPGTPVAVGDAWTGTAESVLNGVVLVTEDRFQLADRKNGLALVEYQSVIGSRGTSEAVGFSGTQRGWIEIEEATGWVAGFRIEQELTGVPGGPETEAAILRMQGVMTMGPFEN